MNISGYTCQATWVASALHVLRRNGIDPDRVLREAHIDIEAGVREDRAPVELIGEVWRLVARLTGDPAIGARAALQDFNAAHWQSLGLAVLCSCSLREALERVVRYNTLVSDVARFHLLERDGCLEFVVDEFAVDPRICCYAAEEYGLAAVLQMLRNISPRPLQPLLVDLYRPADEGCADFKSLFGCPVRFGANRAALVVSADLVDEPLPGGNAKLAAYQDRFSQDYIRRFNSGGFALHVKDEILRQLAGGEPSRAVIARGLHVSVRNLQRKLQAEGTSFQGLLTELRVQLAKEYLGQTYRPLQEVSYLLGFSDPSNFSRAVHRWFGTNPSAARAQLCNDASFS